jgi:hypothetical protein
MGHWELGIGNWELGIQFLLSSAFSLLSSLPLRPSRLRGSFKKSNDVGCEVLTLRLLTNDC